MVCGVANPVGRMRRPMDCRAARVEMQVFEAAVQAKYRASETPTMEVEYDVPHHRSGGHGLDCNMYRSLRLRSERPNGLNERVCPAERINREEMVGIAESPLRQMSLDGESAAPELHGSRPHIGSLLLGYYTDGGGLRYAGRVGTGITVVELERLARRLAPLKSGRMPLDVPPPRESRFGSPLELSRVHWVKPELVVEVTYLTWTEDNLLRQVSYQGERQDKPARQVIRPVPHP